MLAISGKVILLHSDYFLNRGWEVNSGLSCAKGEFAKVLTMGGGGRFIFL